MTALALTEGIARLRSAAFGAHPGGGSPQKPDASIEAEQSKWREVVEAAGARVD